MYLFLLTSTAWKFICTMCSTVDISYFIFKYCRKFDSLFKNSQDISSMDGIDNCVESFVDILYSVCKPLFEKKLPTFNSIIPNKKYSNVLYNEECEI